MSFADQLRAAMDRRGMNQKDLAQSIGASRGAISLYLSGKAMPLRERKNLIAKALGCTVEYLDRKNAPPALPEPVDTIAEDFSAPDRVKDIPVSLAAQLLGKPQQFVRIALQQGRAPFGFAAKMDGGHYSYHISPSLFRTYLGERTEAPDATTAERT